MQAGGSSGGSTGSTGSSTPLVFRLNFDGMAADKYQFRSSTGGGALWDAAYIGPVGSSNVVVTAWGVDNNSVFPEGDSIITAASRSGAGGDRGHRHTLGYGTNQNGGSINIQWGGSTAAGALEFWLQWWARYADGLRPTGTKWSYEKTVECNDPGPVRVTVGWTQQGNGQFGATPYQPQVTYTSSAVWGDIAPSGIADGTWHKYQVHLKANSTTGAGADGVFEMWLDGTQQANLTNVQYSSAPGSFNGWYYLGYSINMSVVSTATPSSALYIDFDDILLSTTGQITQTE